ncbi:MAG: hypothetical protein QOI80_1658, partial [Solirubrobacteraceae bacterium]|nr:hypothetical protein [Solirubrobacteraceae bacterium]
MRRLAAVVAATLALPAAALAAFPQDPPNDPLYDASAVPGATNEQWDMSSDRGISADRAWPLSTGAGIVIADIDVGVQLDQPDLVGKWAPGGHDFYGNDADPTSETRNAHGTNVAGVLAATADNGIDIAGTAPGARLLALRTSDNILHSGARLAEALVYAADHGARVASMSLGADSFNGALRRAVRYAHRRGVVIAVASGNEFHFHHHQPQDLRDVLAVGGVNPDTATAAAFNQDLAVAATDFTVHAPYADYGPHLDVVAPTQVPSTQWGGGRLLNWSGTSAATPHVAGVAALVLGRARTVGLKLSAGEVMQIIRMTADDLYAPGWDQLSGWGRVNAFAAVSRVKAGTIPPDVALRSPQVYTPVRRPFSVRGTVTGRAKSRWELELGYGAEPAQWTRLARGTRVPRRLARIDPRRMKAGGWTLRLRATDARGNVGEDRTFFTNLARDPAVRVRNLRTSGEASPALADLNRDGRADIVLATSGGTVHAFGGARLRELRGWPRHQRRAPHARAAARRIGTVRSGFLATPAVGDVTGDHRPDVVAAGLDGFIYGWSARGRRLKGFPYRIALKSPGHDELSTKLDAAIYASPALADLDRDGTLDIVVGAADQHIYAIDGRGRDLPGWPVLARDTPDGDVTKILSSPAIGDLDGDGHPDVVEGTAEVYGSTPNTEGRVYAFDGAGKRLAGWPIKPPALAADAIPLAGEGTPMSPVLADVDGDGRDEVAIAAFTGMPELYGGDGARRLAYTTTGRGGASNSTAPGVLALGANAAFGRTTAGGPLRLFGGMVDETLVLAQSSPGTAIPFEHVLGGWDAAGGGWVGAFPRTLEGWPIAAAPTLADVDGDGGSEVLAGTSGDVLHAFHDDGSEPAGWPKDLGGWLLAAPTVGDV